jgi:hypothetical protein
MSSQLHIHWPLDPCKRTQYPLNWRLRQAPELVWALFWRREKFLETAGICSLYHLACYELNDLAKNADKVRSVKSKKWLGWVT